MSAALDGAKDVTAPDPRSLEIDGAGLRQLLGVVGETLAGVVDGLGDGPAHTPGVAADVLAEAGGPPSDAPTGIEELLARVLRAAEPAVEVAGPRYFGYIPAGGMVSSAVGELLSRTFNRYSTLSDIAPGLVALEEGVLRWMAEVFGLPDGASGLLTTGGSQAMLSMVLAARERHLGEDLTGARLYLSDQAHHCIRKAARIAGLPASAVRLVPTSDGRRVDPSAAAAMIAEDRAAGLRPFLLVGTAGTTNAGAVDPLAALADLAAEQGLWFHVDGCYGGFFQLTGRGRERLSGIERADSISLDPHKSLFLPYGTGALLVRDPADLSAAHSGSDHGEYLQDLAGTGLPDYAHRSTELTRENRGLRVWLPLHLHGVAAFRAALEEKLDLAAHAHAVLAAEPALEVPGEPDLSTVVFRLREPDGPAGDAANTALLERINASRRVFLSSTGLDGRLTLRLCVLSHRTHAEHVDEALEVIHRSVGTPR